MNTSSALVHAHYVRVFGEPKAMLGYDFGKLQVGIEIFANVPAVSATTIATCGLSDCLGQELLFACYTAQVTVETPKLVGAIAEQLLSSHEALQRGQILGPAGPIQSNASVEAFYACFPSYFPEAIEPLVLASGAKIHFVWLVPLHASEARWAEEREEGTLVLEGVFEKEDPELLDLNRAAVL